MDTSVNIVKSPLSIKDLVLNTKEFIQGKNCSNVKSVGNVSLVRRHVWYMKGFIQVINPTSVSFVKSHL